MRRRRKPLAVEARRRSQIAKRREWLAERARLQSNRCYYCGVEMKVSPRVGRRHAPTLDHVVPLSKGGPDSWFNTVAACLECNSKKSNLSVQEFVERWGAINA